ncbi:hypothetical protein [Enterococcus pallens]|uniref:Uncharacterized protein n=1 Tax=Enterococcus pallens ATCC BAA-351 TaxID=1158607 RepID=R2QE75_9ENTE|nr:hypothetical protein [Enterococcus pallens]EOH94792.1 hypothetical protein UAU_01714 [Enterococcus pallens ATCC BAA-351]EOU14889.1 hypothetical protein I588_04539 [Enterococcus pallens ATCC BAA-351]
MDENISNKIEELRDLCTQEGVSLALAAVKPGVIEQTVLAGRGATLILGIFSINDALEEMMESSSCSCPVCKAAKNVFKTKRRPPIEDDDELEVFLKSIFGGTTDD